jgi:hypothetical protein
MVQGHAMCLCSFISSVSSTPPPPPLDLFFSIDYFQVSVSQKAATMYVHYRLRSVNVFSSGRFRHFAIKLSPLLLIVD